MAIGGDSPTESDIRGGISGGRVTPGQRVDFMMDAFAWSKGVVLKTDASSNKALTRPRGLGPEWDHWVPCDLSCLAPEGSRTQWRQETRGPLAAPLYGAPVWLRSCGGPMGMGFEEGMVECTVAKVEGEGGQAKVWAREVSKPAADPGVCVTMTDSRLRLRNASKFLVAPSSDVLGENDGSRLRVGQSVDVRDDSFAWFTSTIEAVEKQDAAAKAEPGPDEAHGPARGHSKKVAIKVRYDGWSRFWTERI